MPMLEAAVTEPACGAALAQATRAVRMARLSFMVITKVDSLAKLDSIDSK